MTHKEREVPAKVWELYFPDEVETERDLVAFGEDSGEQQEAPDNQMRLEAKRELRVQLYKTFLQFFEITCFNFDQSAKENGIIQIDVQLFSEKEKEAGVKWPEDFDSLSQALFRIPREVIGTCSIALHSLMGDWYSVPLLSERVFARFFNHRKIIPLRKLKANYVEKFITVRGTVVKCTSVKPLVMSMDFECSKCGDRIHQTFPDGRCEVPTACRTPKCKSKQFNPDRDSAMVVNWQRIKVQETNDAEDVAGKVPKTIECELTRDLVDVCIPGDIVSVSGVVKALKNEPPSSFKQVEKNRCLFILYIDGNNLRISKTVSDEMESNQDKDKNSEFSLRDLHAIRSIHCSQNLMKLIVNSLCPSIYGHEIVKAGILLAMFGGCRKKIGEGELFVRGDPHVLVVGDPGLGKSALLKAAANISHRAVYVCANSSTTSGLTVTMIRDGQAGDYSLEAGALVLADQGICCIDEFDKMTADHHALLEAMEQQSISIAKAGIICSLRSRTSILAAANPVGGHYNRAKTVNENLKISAALLSRFDLTFILLDKPDEERDQILSERVISLHSGTSHVSNSVGQKFSFGHSMSDPGRKSESLIRRLRLSPTELEDFDPIPAFLLRKYIMYARQYVCPKMSSDAKEVLMDFYIQLRKSHCSVDGTPITTRQLESMIRLAEARAKVELREEVTGADARDVVEIMKESLADLFTDDRGCVDFTRSSGMSQGKQALLYMRQLTILSREKEDAIFSEKELLEIAKRMNLNVSHFGQFVDKLNQQGFLLKKGNKLYQVSTSEFSQ